MTYFKNPKTLEDLKKQYRDLSMQFHPDRRGSNETMAKINNEYEELFNILQSQSKKDTEKAENINIYKDIINAIINLNIDIEICGDWIWISGNTKPVKEELKQAGFRWAGKKKQWYWRPEGYKKKSRKTWEMQEIRDFYGSQKIKSQEELLQLA